MKQLLILIFFSITLAICSCKNSLTYEKHIKELDSLKTVLSQVTLNFKNIDSNTVFAAYQKQYSFSRFITTHINDTLNKTDAQNLQVFFNTAIGLKTYLKTRSESIANANATLSQLTTLCADLKNNAIETEDAIAYIYIEKQATITTINNLKTNTETTRVVLENYNTSLIKTELFIKQINNNSLPDLIKPNFE